MPLVSIVIPTYNRARDLERALQSVRAQTHTAWEALIVDNHSNDDTDEVVAAFDDSRLRLFKIHNDGIIAASRNLGIANASGEYVAFLDSDDWWQPNKLEESLLRLERGCDVVYHDLYYATTPGQKLFLSRTRSRRLTSPVATDLIVGGNTLGNSSVVVRKTILDGIGGLSEDRELVTWEDYDAWIRIAQLTERIHFIDSCLGYCWRGGGNALNASRTLKNIEAFERRYVVPAAPSIDCVWTVYARGRCLFSLGEHRAAISYFVRVLRKPVAPVTKLKALVLISASAFKTLFRPGAKTAVSNNAAK